ncbi:MAG: ASPIC/UnbV domain-containing protein [Planctomycetes bacterium]|nr:ASPIC/UnbV domain-containing protein [Planctomycetota bacterium]
MASQSPADQSDPKKVLDYRNAWSATNRLMFEGRSWSGHERNCCFLNTGDGRWADISAVSGLDFLDDARAICAVDWDHDGDLDLWINSRSAPRLRLLRNDTVTGNHYIAIQLRGVTCNRDAIGARVTLQLAGESSRRMIQTLRAGDSYLSQSSKTMHFGLGDAQHVRTLEVRWPDGKIEKFLNVEVDRRYRIVQGSGRIEPIDVITRAVKLAPSQPKIPPPSESARIVLISKPPLPAMMFERLDGTGERLGGPRDGPLLVNLWASWCRPCVKEMHEITAAQARIRSAGLEIVGLCVDRLDESRKTSERAAHETIRRTRFPFIAGWATAAAVDKMEVVQRTLIDVQKPLPLPSSFLLDRHGRVAVIYKGAVSIDRLLEDVAALDASEEETRRRAMPFAGRQRIRPAPVGSLQVALKFFEGGYRRHAKDYLRQLDAIARDQRPGHLQVQHAKVLFFLGTLLSEDGENDEALRAWRDLGRMHLKRGELPEAIRHLRAALQLATGDAQTRLDLSRAYYALGQGKVRQGDAAEAVTAFRLAVKLHPGSIPPANDLAWLLATHPDAKVADAKEAIRLAEAVCRKLENRDPSSLDTLAAAYARDGRFADAVKTVKLCIELLRQSKRIESARLSEARLKRYEAGKPYLENLTTTKK